MKKKVKVFLFSTFKTSFIKDDFNHLNNNYISKWVSASGINAIYQILKNCYNHRVYIVWFASTYSALIIFLSKIFNKKTIIIVGGADVIFDQNLGYGLLQKRWKFPIIKFALNNADHIIASSNYIKDNIIKICDKKPYNLSVIYPGVNIDLWKQINKKNNNGNILTVANCFDDKRLKIKGIDIFINVAKEIKDAKFTIIGVNQNLLKNISIPKNVLIEPQVDQKKLLKHYNDSDIYCQFSRKESFGLACVEAILCGCVPIVSNVGGLKEIVENSDLIVDLNNFSNIIKTVKKDLEKSKKTDLKKSPNRFSSFSRYKKLDTIINR